MIWQDKISTIVSAINAQSMYNTASTVTPSNLGLLVYNQSKDWLCMQKAWRDLKVTTQLTLDSDNKVTMPDDFGKCIKVYDDPTATGKPQRYYYLEHPDPAKRYTEETTINETTGVRTIKFCFVPNISISNPYIVYSKVLADATQTEVDEDTKYSFFPINVMLAVAKKIIMRYYGLSANQDIKQILFDIKEELDLLKDYAYNNNTPLDLTVTDSNGHPIFISGVPLDGSGIVGINSNYPNSAMPSGL